MTLRLSIIVIALLAASGFAAYRFAALRLFNLLVPKDQYTEIIARGVRYGAEPLQSADIFAPSQRNRPLPVLVFIHGGSWRDGASRDYAFAGRAFAAKGFLTLVADYRKHPSTEYPGFVEDAASILAFAQDNSARYGGDPARIYAVGHSAGAYNLALAILDRRYLGQAGFSQANLKAFAALAGPFDFLPLDDPTTIATFSKVQDLPSSQPVNFARSDAPPALLLTGDGDTTVFPRNSRNLAAALKKSGAEVELKVYPALGHAGILLALSKPFRDSAPVLNDVASFFARHGAEASASLKEPAP